MKFKGIVLIGDGIPDRHNEITNINNVVIPHEEVLVTDNFDHDKPLGKASLKKVGNKVEAVIEITDIGMLNKITKYRTSFFKPVPCAGGWIDEINESDNGRILKIKLAHIGLSERNSDDRILPLDQWEKID